MQEIQDLKDLNMEVRKENGKLRKDLKRKGLVTPIHEPLLSDNYSDWVGFNSPESKGHLKSMEGMSAMVPSRSVSPTKNAITMEDPFTVIN